MALALKIELIIDSSGDVIYVNDKSGAYDADNNSGGWGTPNVELDQSALALYAERETNSVADDNVISEILTDQIVYDSGAANTKETQWQVKVDADGIYNFWLFRLPVSSNGTTTLEGDAIAEGDIVYYNSALHKMVSSNLELYEGTLKELIDDDDYPQTTCEEFFQPTAIICLWDKYKELIDARNTDCEEDHILMELMSGYADVQGADYAFRSNLHLKAIEINEKNVGKICNC